MGALQDQTAFNIRERADGRKQEPAFLALRPILEESSTSFMLPPWIVMMRRRKEAVATHEVIRSMR